MSQDDQAPFSVSGNANYDAIREPGVVGNFLSRTARVAGGITTSPPMGDEAIGTTPEARPGLVSGAQMNPISASQPSPQITVMGDALQARKPGAGDIGGSTVSTGSLDPNQGPVTQSANAAPQLAPGEAYPGQAANRVAAAIAGAQNQQAEQDKFNFLAAQARNDAINTPSREQEFRAWQANRRASTAAQDLAQGIGPRGHAAAAGVASLQAQAQQLNAPLDVMRAQRAAGPQVPNRNLVTEAIAGQQAVTHAGEKASEAANRGVITQANVARQNAESGLLGAQTKEAGAKTASLERVNNLTSALGAAKTPEERQTLTRQLLLATGHNPDEWTAFHIQGGNDPNNPLIRLPDRVVMTNKNGESKFLDGMGAHGQAAQPSKEDAMAQARDAIAKGAPKDAINARLQSMGYGTL
jgi:hypothetical protein